MVGARGFEPPTSSSRTMRATKLRHAPTEGARSTGPTEYTAGHATRRPASAPGRASLPDATEDGRTRRSFASPGARRPSPDRENGQDRRQVGQRGREGLGQPPAGVRAAGASTAAESAAGGP